MKEFTPNSWNTPTLPRFDGEIRENRDPNIDTALWTRGYAALPSALKRMGFDSLREGQRQGVQSLIGGVDCICVFPTAAGKTATFVIPTLCHGWQALVFSPLKALMRDQVQQISDLGIRCHEISSAVSESLVKQAYTDWVSGECDLMFVAPERLQDKTFLTVMQTKAPDLVVIDEVHTLSNWTDGFRHSYVYIGDFIEAYKPRVVGAFTATCTKGIEADVRRVLRLPKAPMIRHFPVRSELRYSSSHWQDDYDIIDKIREIDGPVLVYCGTRRITEDLAAFISANMPSPDGEVVEVGYYHSEVTESIKKRTQDRFMNGDLRVICATNAFGMGVNKKDIRGVIHYYFPSDPEALYQEAGRAGRDGKTSYCHAFFHPGALRFNESTIRTNNPDRRVYEAIYKASRRLANNDILDASPYDVIQAAGLGKISDYEAKQMLASVNEQFFGSKVFVKAESQPKTYQVTYVGDPEDSDLFFVYQNLIRQCSTRSGDTFIFDLDHLLNLMADPVKFPLAIRRKPKEKDVKDALLAWDKAGFLSVKLPSRATPKRIVGDLSLVDFDRLMKKKKLAEDKLQKVVEYFSTPDREKADYFQAYFDHLMEE
jgi:RecQ family ATP-dependent DNA helicase